MYCFIKYTEYHDYFQDDSSSGKSTNGSVRSVPSKTSLHDNKILLINPDCYVQILIDYIADEIKFDKNADFDLCDDSGQFIKIKELKPWDNASNIMESQKIYIVVLCQRDENGVFKSLEPIVNRNTKDYFDIMIRLKKQIPSSRRLSIDRRTQRKSAEEIQSKNNRQTPRVQLPLRRKSSSSTIRSKMSVRNN